MKALAVDENGQVVARSRVAAQHRGARARRSAPRRQAGLAGRAPQGVRAGDRSSSRRRGTRWPASPWPPWSRRSPPSDKQGVPVLPGPPLRRPRGPGRTATRPATPSCCREPWPTQRASSAGPPPRCPMPAATGPARPWPPTPSRALPDDRYRRHRVARACSTPTGAGTPSCWAPWAWRRSRCRRWRPWARPPARCPGARPSFTGGTIDALCDQIVSGAVHPGDVLVIFGATLICWAVCDEWLTVDGLISYPSTTPDRYLVGGPSNAGALFVDWARHLLRDTPRPGPKREQLEPRLGTARSGSGLVALRARASARRSRTTRCARTSTGSTSDRARRRWSGPPTRRAGSWCGG